jgi:hypothetical protein
MLLAFCIAFLSGCKEEYGRPDTRTYKITDTYTSLEVSSAFAVFMSEVVTEPVITLPELLFDKLIFEVNDRTLKISLRMQDKENVQEAIVKLPLNMSLQTIKADGACKMTAGELPDVRSISLSGASELEIVGSADILEINIAGASTLKARGLDAGTVKGEISGASDADVSVCQTLNVSLSGASELTYGVYDDDCQPKVDCTCSDASEIHKR